MMEHLIIKRVLFRSFLFVCLVHLTIAIHGQQLVDKAAYVRFFSSTPLEDIQAVNEEALGALDLSSGQVAVTMRMDGFEFPKSLMQEHFNENYVESEKYPKALFTGTILDFDHEMIMNLADSTQKFVAGTMEIHGVAQEVEIPVTFLKQGSELQVKTKFFIRLQDHDIKIPRVVMMNIAEEVEVFCKFNFTL
jgi:polyisoprenoid-binding protein YceI